jgi:hypothetical protein
MTSEVNADHKAAEQARAPSVALSHRAGTASKAPPFASIRIKVSDIPDEEKDKLLFEVFDMLLGNDKQLGELSSTALASGAKQCKVKRKAAIPFSRHTPRI